MRLVTLEGDGQAITEKDLKGVKGYLCGKVFSLGGDYFLIPEAVEVADGSLGFFKLPSFKLPSFKLPPIKIPQIAIPKMTLPKIPQIRLPAKLPRLKLPSLPQMKLPNLKIQVPDLGQAVKNLVTNPISELVTAPTNIMSDMVGSYGDLLTNVADAGLGVLDHAVPAFDAAMTALPGALDAGMAAMPDAFGAGQGGFPGMDPAMMMDPAGRAATSSDWKWPWEKDEPSMLPLLLIGGGVLAVVMMSGKGKRR